MERARFGLGSLATLVGTLLTLEGHAQLTWIDTMIPMRDTRELAADVYLPNGGALPRPTILVQTPYWRVPYRFAGLPLVGFDQDGSAYNFVIVDWRGRFGSAAADTGGVIHRGEDGYDCIDWIIAQPWSDGAVGTWGPSALGQVQFETAREGHPAHICAVPLVAATREAFIDYYPGGVLRREYIQQLETLGFVTEALFVANPAQNIGWQIAEATTDYPDEIPVPCLMIGGWYDHNTAAMLDLFSDLRSIGPMPARDQHRLLMGPWAHGGSGTAAVGSSQQGELEYPGAAGWSDSLALRFFDFHLRGLPNGWDGQPSIQYFQMGDDQWHGASDWPEITDTLRLYLRETGLLAGSPSGGGIPPETFTSDPRDPSPTIGGPTLLTTLNQGPYDQVPQVEGRGDVLTFTSDPLAGDISLQGIPIAQLFMSTTAADADVAVRLTDVYPDGRSMLVVDGIRRLRFKDGYTPADTGQVAPGTIVALSVPMTPTSLTFKAGHKIRLDISGSNHPRFDANPQSGGPLYQPGDTVTADISIYHDDIRVSTLVLPGATSTTGSAGYMSSHTARLVCLGDRVHLEGAMFTGKLEWMICDATGRVIRSTTTTNSYLALDHLKGFMVIRCRLPDRSHLQLPIIIE